MAVKRSKRTKRGRRRATQAVKGGTLRLRKEPQAEAAPRAAAELPRAGSMRFDHEELRLPEALAEAGEAESNGLIPGGAVSIIAILAIVFIAIMAWFVSQMPEK
jgi:hypothetical protein